MANGVAEGANIERESYHLPTRRGQRVPPWINPRVPWPARWADLANRCWTFLKKEQEFRLFSSSLFQVSSKRFEN
jgi:hypothetical protein